MASLTTTSTKSTTKPNHGNWTEEEKELYKDKQISTIFRTQEAEEADRIAREQAIQTTFLHPISAPLTKSQVTELATLPTSSGRANQDGFEVSVAPMMAWTTRHYRFMARMLSKRTLLYTEMICTATILHRQDDLDNFLGYDEIEHPIAIQLGGADPEDMKKACIIAEQWGYDEIDINVGCPSDKVAGQGCFGASLMLDHGERVREVVKAVLPVVNIPVTIKCRLGADDVDKYEDLVQFVENLSEAGVTHFIVHARKCLLNGFTPTQNRTIPPLRYDWVHKIARAYPHLEFSINGGFKTMEQILEQRNTLRTETTMATNKDPAMQVKEEDATNETKTATAETKGTKETQGTKETKETKGTTQGGDVKENEEKTIAPNPSNPSNPSNPADSTLKNSANSQHPTTTMVSTPLGDVLEKPLLRGVMVGRAAYQTPWLLSTMDENIYGDTNQNFTRREIMHRYIVYGEKYMNDEALMKNSTNVKSCIRSLLKPVFWMFKGLHNGGAFRRTIELETNSKPTPTFREIVEKAMSILSPWVLDARPSDDGKVWYKEEGVRR